MTYTRVHLRAPAFERTGAVYCGREIPATFTATVGGGEHEFCRERGVICRPCEAAERRAREA